MDESKELELMSCIFIISSRGQFAEDFMYASILHVYIYCTYIHMNIYINIYIIIFIYVYIYTCILLRRFKTAVPTRDDRCLSLFLCCLQALWITIPN